MSQQNVYGVILHNDHLRRTDFLYRISLKCLIRNEQGEVLVVKESGRDYWDLPGGGMDHGENIASAIAREMKEEVNLQGAFSYNIITLDEPAYLEGLGFWQLRLIFQVKPRNMIFSAGDDGDQITFKHPHTFKHATSEVERRIYNYDQTSPFTQAPVY